MAVLQATSVLIDQASRRAVVDNLPEPPDGADKSDAFKRALAAADEAVRQAFRSGDGGEEIGRRLGHLGELYQANRYAERASWCFRSAMDLDPKNPRWPYFLAFVLQERGENEPVTELIELTVRLAPDYSPAWLKLADNRFKKGQLEEAKASYERRLALSPGDPYAHLGLARIALEASQWDAAQSHLEEAVGFDPDFGAAHRMLASIHEHFGRGGQMQEALAQADRSGRFYPAPDPWTDGLLALCFDTDWLLVNAFKYAYVRDGKIANMLFNRAMDLDPDNPKVYLTLGKTVRDMEQARGAFETAISIDPANAEAHSLLGEALLRSNKPVQAEQMLRQALRLGSHLPTTYENLGLCLVRRGRFREALDTIRQALAMEPESIDFNYSLASTLMRAGRTEEAVEQYRNVLRLKPTHARAADELAALLSARGN
ncbi:MAG: tetratricopeptide repeat protein [Acidobacteriota bacterium]